MNEENVLVPAAGTSIPTSIWLPDDGVIRAVVLLGHGLGVDRRHEYNVLPATFLTEAGCAVVAPELPLHGERRTEELLDWNAVVESWQAYWVGGGVRALKKEWSGIQKYAQDCFPDRSLGYFGLSLGTQYGIVFLSNHTAIDAAVLGLFGSLPPPKTPVMNDNAPGVTCPVAFIKQAGDEIHTSESVDHRFDSLGSTTKKLMEAPGLHAAVPEKNTRAATRFLVQHLGVR